LRLRAQLAGMALAAALAVAPTACADAPATQLTGNERDASLYEYRQHLVELKGVVAVCAWARDEKGCDPALVGLDDRVPLSNAAQAERRLVRYSWLRVLLKQASTPEKSDTKNKPPANPPAQPAAGPDQADSKFTRPAKPTTGALLQAAKERLTGDITQADAAAAATQPAASADHSAERNNMKQVLAGRDFRNLKPQSASDSYLEKLGAWLDRLIASIGRLRATSAWVGGVLFWGFILAVCVGLIWGLMQLERRWRIRLVPEFDGPAPGAASARDWQLWLADARRAAAAGEWRDAIHFVYWAAISRLESKRLWPADRTRTPREYLALMAAEDPRRTGLSSLTRSFERVWYGGRAADESDYLHAEQIATALIEGSAPREGGAQ